jgi:hypothetical protein
VRTMRVLRTNSELAEALSAWLGRCLAQVARSPDAPLPQFALSSSPMHEQRLQAAMLAAQRT